MAVQVRGERLFCLERPAGAEQFVLTRRSAVDPDAAPRRPASTRPSAPPTRPTPSTGSTPSPDGALVAFGVSEGGTENSVLRVLDADDGRDLGEAIPNTRACSVAWEPDGSGFAYTRYPEGDEYHRTVHHHRLGDRLAATTRWCGPSTPTRRRGRTSTLSPDGRWLLVHVLVGWAAIDVHLLDRATGDVDDGDRRASRSTTGFAFAADGGSLVGMTTLDAPRGRVVRSPLDAPTDPAAWETLVAEGDAVLGGRRRWPATSCSWSPRTRAVDAVAPLRRRRRARVGAVDGLGDVVAVAGLDADRDDRRRVRRRRLVRRADHRCGASAPADRPSRWSTRRRSTASCRRSRVSQVELPVARRHRDRAVPDPPRRRRARARRRRRSSTATAGSPSPRRRCGRRRSPRGARPAGCTPSPACAAGSSTARPGTTPGAARNKQNVFDDFHAAADWLVATGRTSPRAAGDRSAARTAGCSSAWR